MKGEFYRMDFEAWDEGTDGLSLEHEAAYLRLCHQMYRREGPIPENLNTLARLWRCHPNKAKALLEALIDARKVARHEGHLINTRVTQELDHRETVRTQRRHAGQTGGRRSGDARRKPNENSGGDEAFASTSSNERRGEERREEKKPPVVPLRGDVVTDLEIGQALQAYFELADEIDLPRPRGGQLTAERRKAMKARLSEHGTDGWAEAMRRARKSPHLRGENDRGWKPDIDFFLKKSKLLKILEGSYDAKQPCAERKYVRSPEWDGVEV